MNLPCMLAMLLNCPPKAELPDRIVRGESHAEGAPAGEELVQELGALDVRPREEKIMEWFQAGYWPKAQSRFKPIRVAENGHSLTYWVSADYLRLGNDQDSVLMPLSWIAVRKVLANWGFFVPTQKMVDQIYRAANHISWPHAYPPSEEMRSTVYLVNHNQWVAEHEGFELDDFPLRAGHKKDLTATPRLLLKPEKLAIYGWHNLGNGAAIQPLSLWHGRFYVDYSHGIRLVAPEAELDGKIVKLRDVLRNKELAPLVSFEGAFDICAVMEQNCDGDRKEAKKD